MVLVSLVSAVFMRCWFYPLAMNSGLNSSHPECNVGYWGLGMFPFPSPGLVQNSRFWWTLYLLVIKDVLASLSPNDLLITMYILKLKRINRNFSTSLSLPLPWWCNIENFLAIQKSIKMYQLPILPGQFGTINNYLVNSSVLLVLEVALFLPLNYFAKQIIYFLVTDLLISVIFMFTIFLCKLDTIFSIS